ncbi:MAG: hypothetical protein QOD92_913 [Acidimicrobiaceae bacterium]|jgi:hypothetical protein
MLFALALCVSMTWGLAAPRLDGPDERDHAIRSVATVRGHVIGEFLPSGLGYRMRVRIPMEVCTGVLHDRVLCVPTPNPDEADVDTGEYRHPPPYYAVTGLPSLVWTGVNSSYVMRLVSAVIGSALLGWAFSSAIQTRNRLSVLGVAAVTTPIVWFLISDLNPNGVEIGAAICLWASSLTLARYGPSRQVIRWAGIALTVFVMSRGISPLYAVIALVAAGLIAGKARSRELLGRPDVRRWLVLAAGGACITGVWVLVAGFSHNVHRAGHPVSGALRETGLFLQESVGDWLDLRVSLPYAVAACAAVALPILVLGIARARRGDRNVTLCLLAIALVLPLTSNIMNLPPIASAWQGRYGLPMVAGVIITAAYIGHTDLSTCVWRCGLALLAAAHVGAFVVFVRHWVESSTAATVLIAVNAVGVALLTLVLDRGVSEVAAAPSSGLGKEWNPPAPSTQRP